MLTRRHYSRPLTAALLTVLLSGCALPGSTESDLLSGDRLTRVPEGEDRETVETLLRLGDFTMGRGDIVSAVAMYRRAHEAAPEAIAPLLRLGSALAQAGSFEDSAGAYRPALQLEPVNAEAQRGLGNALVALNRPREGLPYLETALAISNDYRAYNSIGVALDHLGRHQDAQFYYRQGAAVAPNDVSLISNLALSLALSGQAAEAIELARQAATVPSATARHRQTLALVLALSGQMDAAADVARRDLEETEVQSTLQYYRALSSIPDSGQRAAAIGGVGAAAIGP